MTRVCRCTDRCSKRSLGSNYHCKADGPVRNTIGVTADELEAKGLIRIENKGTPDEVWIVTEAGRDHLARIQEGM